MPGWLVALLIVGLPLAILVLLYNSLVAARAQVANGWSQIDVQLKRRHDLIPNLVEAVRGAMAHERETLESVVRWRNQAAALQGADDLGARLQAEGQLSGALGRLLAVMESYPQVRALDNVGALQEELVGTENRIGFARQHYNDVASKFNGRIEQIPANFVAALAGLRGFPLFELRDEAERAAPRVALTR